MPSDVMGWRGCQVSDVVRWETAASPSRPRDHRRSEGADLNAISAREDWTTYRRGIESRRSKTGDAGQAALALAGAPVVVGRCDSKGFL